MDKRSLMDGETNPKRHYQGKKNSDIVNFPVLLRKEVFSSTANKELVNAPITTGKIIFKTLNDISNDQFRAERQPGQMALFEEEFLTEHNVYARFTFDVEDIDEHKDYNAIRRGLEFLENLDKGWHKAVNSKGKTIKSLGGVISNPTISEGKISFLMSSYWVNKFVNLGNYNTAYFQIPWKLSKMKQVLFYLWLLEIPSKGTKIRLDNFNDAYDYNYQTAQLVGKHVLKPLRQKLNECSNISFNYSTRKHLIHITPYYTKDVDLQLKKKTVDKQRITQKLHYWKVRHNLDKENINILKSIINIDSAAFPLFLKSYQSIVDECKRKKKKVTDFQGADFIRLFQNKIIDVYGAYPWARKNPNGYPIIDAEIVPPNTDEDE